jgi:hypothetical protein
MAHTPKCSPEVVPKPLYLNPIAAHTTRRAARNALRRRATHVLTLVSAGWCRQGCPHVARRPCKGSPPKEAPPPGVMELDGKATSRKRVHRTDLERSSIQAIRVAHFLLARVLYADPRDVCHHAEYSRQHSPHRSPSQRLEHN